jgi:hypothetical protein
LELQRNHFQTCRGSVEYWPEIEAVAAALVEDISLDWDEATIIFDAIKEEGNWREALGQLRLAKRAVDDSRDERAHKQKGWMEMIAKAKDKELKPAAAYMRMSSSKQEASPEQQREEAEKLAKLHGCRIIREYADEDISGDNAKRLGFQRMIADAVELRDFAFRRTVEFIEHGLHFFHAPVGAFFA